MLQRKRGENGNAILHFTKAGVDFIGVAVGIFIINDEGNVFLTKRSSHATNEHGTWEIPGGKVNFGETLQNAAKREAREEYDIEIELVEQFPAQNHLIPEEKQHWVPTCFLAKIVGAKQPQIMEPDIPFLFDFSTFS